jgi:hypothetical protein
MEDPEKQQPPSTESSGSLKFRKTATAPGGRRGSLGRNEHLESGQQNVNYSHFAGRIGGNQLFTITSDSPEYEETKERVPDAIVAPTWREIMDLRAFKERRLWEMAMIEGLGVCLQVWSSGSYGRAIVPLGASLSTGPLVPICIACVVQFITITLFTFALGPVTGAHLNRKC